MATTTTTADSPYADTGSLIKGFFQGQPNKEVKLSTINQGQTPVWMQDAIYKQTQLAQNFAQTPWQEYLGPNVAELDPMQTQAYQNVKDNAGAWKNDLWNAQSAMYDQTSNATATGLKTAQNAYLRPNLVDKNLNAGQTDWANAANLNPLSAASGALNKSLGMSASGAADQYLSNASGVDIANAGQGDFSQARNVDIMGAANPYFDSANQNLVTSSQERALAAADPYMKAASASGSTGVAGYMNPYQTSVMDALAQQSSRNLKENILPGVSDAFIKAGNFGSARMGEFGNRAVRDTQQALLQQQGALLNQGYGQAVTASQADLARQAQLAGIAGNTAGADLSRITQNAGVYNQQGQTAAQAAAQQGQLYQNIGQSQIDAAAKQASLYGQLGQTAGTLTAQDMQNYANIGQTQGQLTNAQQQNLTSLGQQQTAAGQAQQQAGINAAQANQVATAQDYARQIGALGQYSGLLGQEQQLNAADNAALEAAGAAQRGYQQQLNDAAKQQHFAPLEYTKNNLDWLSTQIRGLQPITPTSNSGSTTSTGGSYSPSTLANIGQLYNTAQGMTTGSKIG